MSDSIVSIELNVICTGLKHVTCDLPDISFGINNFASITHTRTDKRFIFPDRFTKTDTVLYIGLYVIYI